MTGQQRKPEGPDDVFRRGRRIYPFPVAAACGQVIRSRSRTERLDSILRGGEVLARYLCACAVASFAAREDEAMPVPPALATLTGNLWFGHFLKVVQEVARAKASSRMPGGSWTSSAGRASSRRAPTGSAGRSICGTG